MANVQRRMETMIDEFDVMIRTEFFTNDECRIIKTKRKEFESKLNGWSKSLKVYKEYIAYELTVYRLIKARRNKLLNGDKINQLEHKILQRIRALYETAMQRNPANVEMYLNYFQFCRECNYIHSASKICEKMIQYHGKSEKTWLLAARWHLNEGNDMNEAMTYIKRGLAIHKESKSLYSEYIFCEVLNLNASIANDEDEQEKYDLLTKRLKTVLDKMFVSINDRQTYIDILKWLEKYRFTLPTQDFIIQHLLQKHIESEHLWDFLAQREKRGFHYVLNATSITDCKSSSFMYCIKKYEEGILTVPEENKQSLTDLYLKSLGDTSTEEFSNANLEKKNILISAYEQAFMNACLSEECYLSWLDLVNDFEASRVFEIATEQYPKSICLWNLRLRHEIVKDCRSRVIDTFTKGVEALKEDSCPLWILTLRYHVISSSDEKIEEFYKDAIAQDPNISNLFKPKYLEWVAMKYDAQKSREVFNSMMRLKPYSKELYSTMLKLESVLHLLNDPKEIEKFHLVGTELLGNEDVDVWINYLEYHMYHLVNDESELSIIYNNAKQRLPNDLFMELEQRYRLLRNKKETEIKNFIRQKGK